MTTPTIVVNTEAFFTTGVSATEAHAVNVGSAGSNRVMLALFGWERNTGPAAISNVSYGGNTMSLIASRTDETDAFGDHVALYGLLAPPDNSNTLSADFSQTGRDGWGRVVVVQDCSGWGASNTARIVTGSGVGSSLSLTSTQINSLLLGYGSFRRGDQFPFDPTSYTGNTEVAENQNVNSGAGSAYFINTRAVTSVGSYTLGTDANNDSGNRSLIAVELKEAVAGGTGAKNPFFPRNPLIGMINVA